MNQFPSPKASADTAPARLVVIRQIYLYLVSFVCLVALQSTFNTLTSTAALFWVQQAGRPPLFLTWTARGILESGSHVLVILLIFGVHWTLVCRFARTEPGELDCLWRKLCLWLTLGVSLFWVSSLLAEPMVSALQVLTGHSVAEISLSWPYLVTWLAHLLLSGTILAYFTRLVYQERHCGTEARSVNIAEGLSLAIVSLVALLLCLSALHGVYFSGLVPILLNLSILDFSLGNGTRNLPEFAATVWVSLLVLTQVWHFRQRLSRGRQTAWTAGLHVGYLYLAQLAGVSLLLYGTIQLCEALVDLLPDSDPASHINILHGINALLILLSSLPLGLVCWLWFRRALAQAPEVEASGVWAEFLKRLYCFCIVGMGLLWLAHGSWEIVDTLLSGVADEAEAVQPIRVADEPINKDLSSTTAVPAAPGGLFPEAVHRALKGLAEVLTGACAIFLAWRSIRRFRAIGRSERHGWWLYLPRRLYLYGTVFVSTVILLITGGRTLYGLLLRMLDEEQVREGEPTGILVTLAMLLVHARLLRGERNVQSRDGLPAQEEQALHRELAMLQTERQRVEARIAAVEKELAALHTTASNQAEDSET